MNIYCLPQSQVHIIGLIPAGQQKKKELDMFLSHYHKLTEFNQRNQTFLYGDSCSIKIKGKLPVQSALALWNRSSIIQALNTIKEILPDLANQQAFIILYINGDVHNNNKQKQQTQSPETKNQIEQLRQQALQLQEIFEPYNLTVHLVCSIQGIPWTILKPLQLIFKGHYLQIAQIDSDGETVNNSIKQELVQFTSPQPLFPWKKNDQLHSSQSYIVTLGEVMVKFPKDEKVEIFKPETQVSLEMLISLGKEWFNLLKHLESNSSECFNFSLDFQQAEHELVGLYNQYIKQEDSIDSSLRNNWLDVLEQYQRYDIEKLKKLIGHVPYKSTSPQAKLPSLLLQYGISDRILQNSIVNLLEYLRSDEIDYTQCFQESSYILCSNTKDILGDPDYQQVLEKVKDPRKITEYFPLIGQGLILKRLSINEFRLWGIQVINVSIGRGLGDTTYINRFPLPQKAEYNLVLPLYSMDDKDLKKWLRSTFFDFLFQFQTFKIVGIAPKQLYAGLLSSYLIHLLDLPSTQWKETQLELIYSSYMLKYEDEDEFNAIKTLLLSSQPQKAFLDSKVSLTQWPKVLLVFFIIFTELKSKLNQDLQGLRNIVDIFVMIQMKDEIRYNDIASFTFDSPKLEKQLNQFIPDVRAFLQLHQPYENETQLKYNIQTCIASFIEQIDDEITIKHFHDRIAKNLYQYFCASKLNIGTQTYIAVHLFNHQTIQQRIANQIETNNTVVRKKLKLGIIRQVLYHIFEQEFKLENEIVQVPQSDREETETIVGNIFE